MDRQVGEPLVERAAKLVCRHVWKLFGDHAAQFLAGGTTDKEAIQAAGLVPAVADANISISEGEIFVIMGLSGSGKSTLVRCLSRLIEPTSGEILLDGDDLLRASKRDMIAIRRHKMGMVFQHFALLPHRDVRGNVAFPLEVQGIDRKAREAKAAEMIDLVGLSGRERSYPRQLSGGQQQRVGIARSLATNPDLWFLDEPFSALDPLIRREMQNELLRLQDVLKKTIIFITHDFDEAIRLADRIAIMQDGRLVQIGTPEELILAPATDYVAAFTADAPKARILSAKSVMHPFDAAIEIAGEVPALAKIADIGGQVEAADTPFAVVENDMPVGLIDRDAVMSVLLGKDQPT